MKKEITYSLAAASIFGIVALILAIRLSATKQQTELEGLVLTLSTLLTTGLVVIAFLATIVNRHARD